MPVHTGLVSESDQRRPKYLTSFGVCAPRLRLGPRTCAGPAKGPTVPSTTATGIDNLVRENIENGAEACTRWHSQGYRQVG